MCDCGCNTCETKQPLMMINESLAPKQILSEGLKHHMDNNKPLTEHLYRAGSTGYFNLFAEARSLYSRGILDITNADDLALLTETNLGHFGIFEQTSTVSKRRAGAELKQKLKGTRSDGMGKYDATVYGLDSEGKRVELKSLNDLNKFNKFELAESKKVPLDFPIELEESLEETTMGDVFIKNLKKVIQQKFKFSPKITTMPNKSIVVFYPTFLRKQFHPFFDSLMEKGAIGDFAGIGMVVTDVENKSDNTTLKLASQPFKNNPLLEEALNEAKKKKKKKNTKKLNKPMRDSSGGKAYKVYVKDPKTGNIKTIRFGSGGLKAKINNKKARDAFAARHKCSTKNDKTKAGYWSCRLPRYAKLLGLKSSFSGFW